MLVVNICFKTATNTKESGKGMFGFYEDPVNIPRLFVFTGIWAVCKVYRLGRDVFTT